MVDIYQVEKGMACGCQCSHCFSPLIARKGEKNTHHFAHQSGAVCHNAYETSIHKMAKQILMDEKGLQLPGLHISVKDQNKMGVEHIESEQVCEPRWISFDEVREELTLGSIRADIVGYKNKHPLIIEIMVTHASGKNKKNYIRNQAWAAIEIKLIDLGYQADTKMLKENILDSLTNKYWLSHPRVPKIKQSLRQKLKDIIIKDNKKYELDAEESIRRQKRMEQYRVKEYLQMKRNRVRPARAKPAREVSPDQYSIRYFICDNCDHIFEIKQKKLNELEMNLLCPKCNKPVNQHAL